jgi:hypothetical protein
MGGLYVRYGTRLSGKVDQFAGSYIATRFFHIYYVPLVPMSSWLVLRDGSGVAIPLNLRSVAAAYLRGVATLAAIGTLIAALATFSSHGLDGDNAWDAIWPALLGAGAVFGWFFLGRLSRRARGERMIYADSIGQCVDPARLGDARHALIEKLRKDVQARAQALAGIGYRESYDPQSAWRRVAARPSTKELGFLKQALTLARLEWSFADGPHRAELARDHALIYENIEREHPDAVNPARVAIG